MGNGSSSKKGPLGCMLKHFKEGFQEGVDYGVKLSVGKLRTLCESKWPAFGVGWPETGSFDPQLVRAVWDVVTGDPGYPDQFPYIDQWLALVRNPPSCIKNCALQIGAQVLVVGSKADSKKIQKPENPALPPTPGPIVLPPPPEEKDLPPPYNPALKRRTEMAREDTPLSPSHTRSGSEYGSSETLP